MSFKKSDVFHVVDTLHNGVVGSWQAFRMGEWFLDFLDWFLGWITVASLTLHLFRSLPIGSRPGGGASSEGCHPQQESGGGDRHPAVQCGQEGAECEREQQEQLLQEEEGAKPPTEQVTGEGGCRRCILS